MQLALRLTQKQEVRLLSRRAVAEEYYLHLESVVVKLLKLLQRAVVLALRAVLSPEVVRNHRVPLRNRRGHRAPWPADSDRRRSSVWAG